MDLSKYPLERLFHFVAATIPGFVALAVWEAASPEAFAWFFDLRFLGYRTKLALIVVVCFVVGNSMTRFLTSILAGIGGGIGAIAYRGEYKKPESHAFAPWRDRKWRDALKHHLGSRAPNDTEVVTDLIFGIRKGSIEMFKQEAERPQLLRELGEERAITAFDDGQWAEWYEHYHQKIAFNLIRTEVEWYIQTGLAFNLQTASVYLLASSIVVPAIRRWWIMLPATMWVILAALEVYAGVHRYLDKWSTLYPQIQYLMGESAKKPPKEAKEAAEAANF